MPDSDQAGEDSAATRRKSRRDTVVPSSRAFDDDGQPIVPKTPYEIFGYESPLMCSNAATHCGFYLYRDVVEKEKTFDVNKFFSQTKKHAWAVVVCSGTPSNKAQFVKDGNILKRPLKNAKKPVNYPISAMWQSVCGNFVVCPPPLDELFPFTEMTEDKALEDYFPKKTWKEYVVIPHKPDSKFNYRNPCKWSQFQDDIVKILKAIKLTAPTDDSEANTPGKGAPNIVKITVPTAATKKPGKPPAAKTIVESDAFDQQLQAVSEKVAREEKELHAKVRANRQSRAADPNEASEEPPKVPTAAEKKAAGLKQQQKEAKPVTPKKLPESEPQIAGDHHVTPTQPVRRTRSTAGSSVKKTPPPRRDDALQELIDSIPKKQKNLSKEMATTVVTDSDSSTTSSEDERGTEPINTGKANSKKDPSRSPSGKGIPSDEDDDENLFGEGNPVSQGGGDEEEEGASNNEKAKGGEEEQSTGTEESSEGEDEENSKQGEEKENSGGDESEEKTDSEGEEGEEGTDEDKEEDRHEEDDGENLVVVAKDNTGADKQYQFTLPETKRKANLFVQLQKIREANEKNQSAPSSGGRQGVDKIAPGSKTMRLQISDVELKNQHQQQLRIKPIDIVGGRRPFKRSTFHPSQLVHHPGYVNPDPDEDEDDEPKKKRGRKAADSDASYRPPGKTTKPKAPAKKKGPVPGLVTPKKKKGVAAADAPIAGQKSTKLTKTPSPTKKKQRPTEEIDEDEFSTIPQEMYNADDLIGGGIDDTQMEIAPTSSSPIGGGGPDNYDISTDVFASLRRQMEEVKETEDSSSSSNAVLIDVAERCFGMLKNISKAVIHLNNKFRIQQLFQPMDKDFLILPPSSPILAIAAKLVRKFSVWPMEEVKELEIMNEIARSLPLATHLVCCLLTSVTAGGPLYQTAGFVWDKLISDQLTAKVAWSVHGSSTSRPVGHAKEDLILIRKKFPFFALLVYHVIKRRTVLAGKKIPDLLTMNLALGNARAIARQRFTRKVDAAEFKDATSAYDGYLPGSMLNSNVSQDPQEVYENHQADLETRDKACLLCADRTQKTKPKEREYKTNIRRNRRINQSEANEINRYNRFALAMEKIEREAKDDMEKKSLLFVDWTNLHQQIREAQQICDDIMNRADDDDQGGQQGGQQAAVVEEPEVVDDDDETEEPRAQPKKAPLTKQKGDGKKKKKKPRSPTPSDTEDTDSSSSESGDDADEEEEEGDDESDSQPAPPPKQQQKRIPTPVQRKRRHDGDEQEQETDGKKRKKSDKSKSDKSSQKSKKGKKHKKHNKKSSR